MQHIGVLGGTFDPIHYGHLAIAAEVHAALQLEYVFVVPAAQQPFKSGQHIATPQQRLEMVRQACAGNTALVPSDVDLRRPPPSYTVDTLRELCRMVGERAALWFIMGSDALASFPRWHAASEILQLARLAVVTRPHQPLDLEGVAKGLPALRERTCLVEGPLLEISSSDLRERLATGRPVRYQMPDSVLEYIHEQQLYRTAQPANTQ